MGAIPCGCNSVWLQFRVGAIPCLPIYPLNIELLSEKGRNCRNSSSNSKEDMSADPERQSKYFYNRVWCGEFP